MSERTLTKAETERLRAAGIEYPWTPWQMLALLDQLDSRPPPAEFDHIEAIRERVGVRRGSGPGVYVFKSMPNPSDVCVLLEEIDRLRRLLDQCPADAALIEICAVLGGRPEGVELSYAHAAWALNVAHAALHGLPLPVFGERTEDDPA